MSEHSGIAAPSDTHDAQDGGTAWPLDSFTRAVTASSPAAASTPAPHSYAGDGNMEAFDAIPPYAVGGEDETDVARYTGAVGGR